MSQLTTLNTLEARSKRRKRAPASSLPNMAHVLGRMSPARAVLLSRVLDADALSSLIASFMPTRDLVMASCVNSAWLQTFSQPGCWQHTRLVTNSTLNTADILQHLAKMPHLHALMLSATHDLLQLQPTGWFDSRATRAQSTASQLSAPRSHSLAELAIVGQINARLLQALPDLTSFTGDLKIRSTDAYNDVRFPPNLQKLDLWSTLTTGMVDALLRHPPVGLQRCQLMQASPNQYRQLVSVCAQLRTLHFIADEANYIEVINILSACQQLTSLAIDMSYESTECTAQVMEALLRLPRLTTLKLFEAQVDTAFWDRLHELRTTMVSHLPIDQHNDKQRVQIEIRAHAQLQPVHNADVSDGWWLSALIASSHCSVLELELDDNDEVGPTDEIVQQYLDRAAALNDAHHLVSSLQTFDYDCFAADNKRHQVLSFVQLQSSLTTLNVEKFHGWSGVETMALLSGLPALTTLSMNTHHPAVVQAALSAAGSLQRIQTADIRVEYRKEDLTPGLLPQLLNLIQAATSLRWLSIAALTTEWQAVAMSHIKMSAQHLDELRVTLVDSYEDDGDEQSPDPLIHGLLTVPSLTYLLVSLAMNEMLGDIVIDSWRTAGMKRVRFEVDGGSSYTLWDDYHYSD